MPMKALLAIMMVNKMTVVIRRANQKALAIPTAKKITKLTLINKRNMKQINNKKVTKSQKRANLAHI